MVSSLKKAPILLLAILTVAAPAPADDVKDEYVRRFKALERDDLRGHVELADWCRDQQRWTLVAQQCRQILRIDPVNERAKLMLQEARAKIEQQQREERDEGQGRGGDGALPRLLSDEEVQRIRRWELQLDEKESVNVRIDRRAEKDFIEWAQTDPTFPYSSQEFFRLRPLAKAQLMLKKARDKFGDKITIRSDPERMRQFDRDVMPIVLRNCATAECHGGAGASKLQLYTGRAARDHATYTNFYILHEYESDEGRRLIDRNVVRDSMLLSCGLPPRGGHFAPLNHPTSITPVFDDTQDRDYQTILEWLRSLSIERPDYGIDLGKPAP